MGFFDIFWSIFWLFLMVLIWVVIRCGDVLSSRGHGAVCPMQLWVLFMILSALALASWPYIVLRG